MKVTVEELKVYIEERFDNPEWVPGYDEYDHFIEFKHLINRGLIRAAENIDGAWVTNTWVKKYILLGFKLGKIADFSIQHMPYFDKHTYPVKQVDIHDQIRVVPGGTSVRDGAYIGKNVTIMPPSYINVGAFIDDQTMIDSHALVGSCAQIGKNVHVSAAAIIGGVLEPIGANPVIIEDEAFIGGNTGIYEGTIIHKRAIIAAGVILTAGTPVYDAIHGYYLPKPEGKGVTIPENAVVVSGTRMIKNHPDHHVYCPIIIKYRDEKTESSVVLESLLR